MAKSESFFFYDADALLERLSRGVKKHPQNVVFLVGAPLSEAVPGVDGIIDLIRAEFEDDPLQTSAVDAALAAAGDRRYQAAFVFLQGRRGQQRANEIVRAAVRAARKPHGLGTAPEESGDEGCRLSELQRRLISPARTPGKARCYRILRTTL